MKFADDNLQAVYLKPGQVCFIQTPTVVTTVLGSCVAVTMYGKKLGVAAICHAMLPACRTPEACASGCLEPYKYVECAVPKMIRWMRRYKMALCDIEVKVFGAADMIAALDRKDSVRPVGRQNLAAVRGALARAGVRITAEDTGGAVGRKIHFRSDTGEVFLKRLGKRIGTATKAGDSYGKIKD